MINRIRTYSQGVGGVNYQKCNNNTTYYLKNGHSNIISECTNDGTINTYDAFGNTSLSISGFGYCGEYQDTESNLTYLRARFYDQSTGSFISEDPIKDGMNWYSYCDGNPVRYFDSSGMLFYKDKHLSDENWQRSIDALASLTNDKLIVENGVIRIEEQEITDKPLGTELLRQAIKKPINIAFGNSTKYEYNTLFVCLEFNRSYNGKSVGRKL